MPTTTSVELFRPDTPSPVRRGPALAAAVVGIIAVLTGTIAILTLHLMSPTALISPLRRTISEYAYTTLGWVFNSGVVLIAAGSLLIAGSLWFSRSLPRLGAGTAAMLGWSASLVVLVIFPKHNWSVGPAGHGTVHRIASLVAFVCVPIAAIALARRRTAPFTRTARLALMFAWISAGWLATLMAAFIIGPFTGTPWWLVFPLGLMERGMAFFAILAVVGVGALAVRAARAPRLQP